MAWQRPRRITSDQDRDPDRVRRGEIAAQDSFRRRWSGRGVISGRGRWDVESLVTIGQASNNASAATCSPESRTSWPETASPRTCARSRSAAARSASNPSIALPQNQGPLLNPDGTHQQRRSGPHRQSDTARVSKRAVQGALRRHIHGRSRPHQHREKPGFHHRRRQCQHDSPLRHPDAARHPDRSELPDRGGYLRYLIAISIRTPGSDLTSRPRKHHRRLAGTDFPFCSTQ